MASLNEIAYNLLQLIRGGEIASSEYISLEQIKFIIKYYRTTFLRRDALRNSERLQAFEQDLGIIELVAVNSAQSNTYNSTHIIKRTTKQIPTPIRFHRKLGITHISTVGKFDEPIPLLDTVRNYYQQYNKYTSDLPFAVYKSKHLYLENSTNILRVNVRGVFEDPEEVHKFTRAQGFDLYDEDSPFPISQDMLEGITKGILSGELSIAVQSPTDESTDNLQSGKVKS